MNDTVKKVSSASAPVGPEGQIILAAGERLAMRMWRHKAPTDDKPTSVHNYEVVGYALEGRAELVMAGQAVKLEPGDSWLVPAGAEHTYRIVESFTAVETTAPPFHVENKG